MSISDAVVGLCELELYLPGIRSLKEKRSIVRSLLARVRNQFSVAISEVGHLDRWQLASVAVVCVSNSGNHNLEVLRSVLQFIETHFPEAEITRHEIELL